MAVAPEPVDRETRARDRFAVDPRQNVVLEASAGTGKTSVLVLRYINLLKAGVDPANILAMTFTRKAAAEMRERIIRELKASADRSEFDRARWNDLRDRLGDVAISTIDAFCLSLLREFPLEAGLDPGFDMADETEVPRLVDEALDRSMRIFAADGAKRIRTSRWCWRNLACRAHGSGWRCFSIDGWSPGRRWTDFSHAARRISPPNRCAGARRPRWRMRFAARPAGWPHF